MEKHPLALVTGATSGIGERFAAEYARRGHDLVLVARRADELERIAGELRERHGVEAIVLPCDLADAGARRRLVDDVAARGLTVDVLVNNAGYGQLGPFVEADPERTTGMVELNCQALVELAQAFLPGMRERGRGTIVNVASSAAFQPLPDFAVYGATKAFVLSFSQALWSECRGTGVKVTAICPGPTETAFFDVAGADDVMTQRRTPEQVVETTFKALSANKPFAVDGPANVVGAWLGRLLPYAVVEKAVGLLLHRKG